MSELNWTVADPSQVGFNPDMPNTYPVVHRCNSEEEAAQWVSNHPDKEKVYEGIFEICGPAQDEADLEADRAFLKTF